MGFGIYGLIDKKNNRLFYVHNYPSERRGSYACFFGYKFQPIVAHQMMLESEVKMNTRRNIEKLFVVSELLLPALFYTFADFGTGEPVIYAIVCYYLFVMLLVNHFTLMAHKLYRFTIMIIQIPAIISWITNSGQYFVFFDASLPITISGSIAHGIISGHNLLFFIEKLGDKNR